MNYWASTKTMSERLQMREPSTHFSRALSNSSKHSYENRLYSGVQLIRRAESSSSPDGQKASSSSSTRAQISSALLWASDSGTMPNLPEKKGQRSKNNFRGGNTPVYQILNVVNKFGERIVGPIRHEQGYSFGDT